MAIKILIGLAVLIVLLVVVIATRPSRFHVERSTTIAAPAENIFARVDDLRAWSSWSRWEKKDPQMKRTFGGPPAGVGATYSWAGDKNVGEGRMTIERSERPSLIEIKLEFFKPWEGTNTSRFSFAPAGNGTKVTWWMDGRYNFMSKAVCMVMDMDKMIGNDFDAGLAALKAEAEAGAAPPPLTTEPGTRIVGHPPGAPVKRFMLIFKPDKEPEPGVSPCRQQLPEMAKLMDELKRSGTVLATEGLLPSDSGARVRLSAGKLTIRDGPFAEAKELVAGFAIVRVNSKPEAVELAKRFLSIAGGGESDVLEVWEPPPVSHDSSFDSAR